MKNNSLYLYIFMVVLLVSDIIIYQILFVNIARIQAKCVNQNKFNTVIIVNCYCMYLHSSLDNSNIKGDKNLFDTYRCIFRVI